MKIIKILLICCVLSLVGCSSDYVTLDNINIAIEKCESNDGLEKIIPLNSPISHTLFEMTIICNNGAIFEVKEK